MLLFSVAFHKAKGKTYTFTFETGKRGHAQFPSKKVLKSYIKIQGAFLLGAFLLPNLSCLCSAVSAAHRALSHSHVRSSLFSSSCDGFRALMEVAIQIIHVHYNSISVLFIFMCSLRTWDLAWSICYTNNLLSVRLSL